MAQANPSLDHESSDVNIRGVVFAAVGLAVVTLLSIGLVTGLFVYLNRAAARTEESLPMPPEAALPAEPRLQRDPAGALREMRAEESRILDDYRWIDKEAGLARIPIDRAMKLALEQGLLKAGAPVSQATTTAASDEQRATSAKPGVAR
jgi:hypothetical protein